MEQPRACVCGVRACVIVGLLVLPVVVVVAVVPSRDSVCRPNTRVRCVNEKGKRGRAACYPKIAEANVIVVVVVAVAVVVVAVIVAAVAPTRDSTLTSRAKGVGCSS